MKTKLILAIAIVAVILVGVWLFVFNTPGLAPLGQPGGAVSGPHVASTTLPVPTISTSSMPSNAAVNIPVSVNAAVENLTMGICKLQGGQCEVLDAKGGVRASSKLLGGETANVLGSSSRDTFVVLENLFPSSTAPFIDIYLFPQAGTKLASGTLFVAPLVGQFPAVSSSSLYGMTWSAGARELSVDILIPKTAASPARIETKRFVLQSNGRVWLPQ